MGKQRGSWHDGHRAWQRLIAWLDATVSRSGSRDNDNDNAGDAALDAMADIGTIRRLLDQAELVAVRNARRHRKSWAEIATQLGITRQSAWERWRDLDETTEVETELESTTTLQGATYGVASDITDEMLTELSRDARAQRRRAKVVVPTVVGMSWDDARIALIGRRLIPEHHDPDGPPLAALGWPNTVVVDQIPEAGAKVPVGTRVRLWLERGGGSAGVREPRRPLPDPKGGYEWRDEPSGQPSDEPSGEAVG